MDFAMLASKKQHANGGYTLLKLDLHGWLA